MNKKLNVGDSATISKVFNNDDVEKFAIVSEDCNPIHLDETAAADSIFGQRVVHGMLVGSLFSALLGTKLPGEGSIYLGQTLSFKAPVFIGEEVTASVEILEIRESKSIAKLRTLCVNSSGVTVIDGEAVVKFS
ncbi:MAG: MaoC family dehydratase [Pseudomonadales bacterium]